MSILEYIVLLRNSKAWKPSYSAKLKLCIYSERYCTGLILGVLYKFIHKSIVAANAIWAVKHLLSYFSQIEKEDQAPLKIGLLNSLGLIFYCYGHLLSFFTQTEWSNANWINCHIGSTNLLSQASFVVLHTDQMQGFSLSVTQRHHLINWINWLTHTVTGNY